MTSTGSNPIKSGLLCLLCGIKYRLGENIKGKGVFYSLKIPFNPSLHEVESNILLVERIGIKVQNHELFVYTEEKDTQFAENFFLKNNLERKLVIGLHPGSGIHQAGFKRWPKEKFARLADWMLEHGAEYAIFFPDFSPTYEQLDADARLEQVHCTDFAWTQAAGLKNMCAYRLTGDTQP